MAKEEAGQREKKGVPMVLAALVAAVALLLGISGTLGLMITGLVPVAGLHPEYTVIRAVDAEDHSARAPIYIALEPPFVVNVDRNGRRAFLQITVEVMTRNEELAEALQAHTPVIRNNLLMLFGTVEYAEVQTREGKDRLRHQALAEINKVLKDKGAPALLEELYFTGFVMQ
ncbi:hypothetical protein CAI21_11760 [Alkalilimnicola ehrlichii]|uniref:Flagellar protein FliL n=1 Tax=Alkalilimnicola ehrlichii TaxID=351052 RepID=A0A3E0WRU9_9GAMM|nr:flagellar basal body-associated FliL family protein [Alkalilimnicola ehrlichii]RFA28538.1 hypothetical protein CAI21_11760 [Alkalilimnicola ehrlichii]RFA35700.1 hypothetical protein CAL65_12280 [Alkalilimnicola ehrlichii]